MGGSPAPHQLQDQPGSCWRGHLAGRDINPFDYFEAKQPHAATLHPVTHASLTFGGPWGAHRKPRKKRKAAASVSISRKVLKDNQNRLTESLPEFSTSPSLSSPFHSWNYQSRPSQETPHFQSQSQLAICTNPSGNKMLWKIGIRSRYLTPPTNYWPHKFLTIECHQIHGASRSNNPQCCVVIPVVSGDLLATPLCTLHLCL